MPAPTVQAPRPPARRFIFLWALLFLVPAIPAATHLDLSTNVVRRQVARFGIGLAQHNYYDSNQMMKELLFRNPGFEGLLFQSVVRLGAGGTATNGVEDQPLGSWPSGFWDGAAYEIIWSAGTAQGRAGTLLASVAPNRPNDPNDVNGSTQGTTYVFADSDPARPPAMGDYLVLRKTETGGNSGGAAFGSWDLTLTNGGTITSETIDLPPPPTNGPAGQQCIRLSALAVTNQASLRGSFDTLQGFLHLDGQFRLAFKAKGAGGANRLQASVRRGTSTPYLNATVNLTTEWTDYQLPFEVHESNDVSGAMTVTFAPVNQSEVLLDDVSLRQINSSPDNPTEFRDPVVAALRDLQPGILRYVNWQNLGNAMDNELAPVMARKRSGYSVYSTTENNLMPGLHEFLVLCEHLDADPWYSIPVTFSTQEVADLMEYLGGPTNTVYGNLRARRGHPGTWTGVFRRIHLEFGNENWNNTAFRGGSLSVPAGCGARASELFSVIKGSPYYASNQISCILGTQAGNPGQGLQVHNASPQHDVLTVGPYMSGRVDSFDTTEALFGPLFAEPEWWSFNPSPTSGLMALHRLNLQNSSRPVPLSVYEVNLHTTAGSISQQVVDVYTPSVGAALAVADHMLLMLRELDVRDQVFFSLAGHRTSFTDGSGKTAALWGSVLDMGKTDRRRPHYHALQLLNTALAGDLLHTTQSGDNPTWGITNQNRVTFTHAHAIQSYAFRDGPRRALVVFNLDRVQAREVTFGGSLAPTGSVHLRRLTSDAITDHNETSNVVSATDHPFTEFDPAQPLALPPFSMNLLQWEEPAPVIHLLQDQAVPSGFTVAWTSRVDRTYRVSYSPDLDHWEEVAAPVPGSNGPAWFNDDGSQSGGITPRALPQRFYRISVVE